MRYGEDIEFSIRMINAGYKTGLIPDAFFYHKRRTDFFNFFKQISHSGAARINFYKMYPNELKPVYCLSAIFTLYCLLTLIMIFINLKIFNIMASLLFIYVLAIFLGSTFENRSFKVGFLSILAAFVQLFGYGIGFIYAYWKRVILKK